MSPRIFLIFSIFLSLTGLQLVAFGVLQRTLRLLAQRLRWPAALANDT